METIAVEVYRDAYGERLALKYKYNADTNQLLKDGLTFPRFMWDKEQRAWSIQNVRHVVSSACELLEGVGVYDTTLVRKHGTTLTGNEQIKSECWTKVKRTRLYLHWPYISDSNLRETVRLAVRSISNRKFHAEDKCWSIPVAHARTV